MQRHPSTAFLPSIILLYQSFSIQTQNLLPVFDSWSHYLFFQLSQWNLFYADLFVAYLASPVSVLQNWQCALVLTMPYITSILLFLDSKTMTLIIFQSFYLYVLSYRCMSTPTSTYFPFANFFFCLHHSVFSKKTSCNHIFLLHQFFSPFILYLPLCL